MRRKTVGTVFQEFILLKWEESGLNKKEFCKKYNLATTFIDKLVQKEDVNITTKLIDRILDGYNIDMAYVIKHQGEYYEE